MRFWKYHGLGNDYVVVEPDHELTSAEIQRICHRHYGIGSDGILVQTTSKLTSDFAVRIFNPDGSEAEKSGNGLRIFARFLFEQGLVTEKPFTIATLGNSLATAVVSNGGLMVEVDMGYVDVGGEDVQIVLGDELIVGRVASLGNPHFVVMLDEAVSAEIAHYLGPQLESHSNFPQRTNVQFANVLNRSTLHIEIWERGAGYTLASGSSSCAAAAVAHQLGLVDAAVAVKMPGGQLSVRLDEQGNAHLRGPVAKVARGHLSAELFA